MYRIKYPSLHLNWIRNLDKTICNPILIYADEECEYSGCFVHPFNGEWWFEDFPIDGEKGIMIISGETENEANTIAHEFRHLWQFINGWKYDSFKWKHTRDYKKQIINFFRSSKMEMDALLWSQKKAPCNMCEEWIEWLKHDYQLNIKN